MMYCAIVFFTNPYSLGYLSLNAFHTMFEHGTYPSDVNYFTVLVKLESIRSSEIRYREVTHVMKQFLFAKVIFFKKRILSTTERKKVLNLSYPKLS